jgi:ferritin-like metal-binding protein YciE
MKKQMNLDDLLASKLHVLYDIESALVRALPTMAKAACNTDLQEGFLEHLEETKNHVRRIEQAHKLLGIKPKKLKSEAIRGLAEDAKWVIQHVSPEEARDANLVRAAQYVEHYEMAGYRGAIAWAKAVGADEVARLLNETLQEEVAADKKLDMLGMRLDKAIA